MDHFKKSIILLLIVSLLASCLYGCADSSAQPTEVAQPVATDAPAEETAPLEVKDYAASVKLDMSSGTAKQEVTVKQFVDGDTTHFNVPSSVIDSGVLNGYDATPESMLAKLMFLLGHGLSKEEIIMRMNESLCGEITID